MVAMITTQGWIVIGSCICGWIIFSALLITALSMNSSRKNQGK